MTQTPTTATVRLAVRGVAGTVDLVAPWGARVEDLSREYAAVLGLDRSPRLALVDGTVPPPDRTVHAAGLRHGAVLVSLDDAAPDDGSVELDAAGPPQGVTGGSGGLVLVALVAGLLAAVTAAVDGGDGRWRAGAAAALLLGAVLALLPRHRGNGGLTRVAAPGLAATAAFAGLHQPAEGGLLLAVAVAGLAAAAAAALGRSESDRRLDDLMRAWLVTAVTVTAVAAVLLLVGAGGQALWAVLMAAAVLVAKLLPGAVVDVPDHLLLDLERLAVTAWTARDRPSGGRRRRMTVHREAVADVVRRGHRLIAATTVAVAVATLVSAPLLLLAADGLVPDIGARSEVLLAGAALALMSRSYRARLPRLALRTAGAWCLVLVPVSFLPGLDQAAVLAGIAGLAVVTTAVLVAAAAMGHGWRSVWWARVGEVLEELCVALCLAALPVAAGLFDFVRSLTS